MESASSRPDFDLGYNRFRTTSEHDKQKILDDRNSSSTNKATKGILKILTDYISEKDLPNLELTPDAELPHLLETFYADLSTQDGKLYKLASLKCIRVGLNRHFKEKRSLDIIADPLFTEQMKCSKAWLNKHTKKAWEQQKATPSYQMKT